MLFLHRQLFERFDCTSCCIVMRSGQRWMRQFLVIVCAYRASFISQLTWMFRLPWCKRAIFNFLKSIIALMCTLEFDIYHQNGNLFDYETTLRLECIKWQLPLFSLVHVPISIYLYAYVNFGFVYLRRSINTNTRALIWDNVHVRVQRVHIWYFLLTFALILLLLISWELCLI